MNWLIKKQQPAFIRVILEGKWRVNWDTHSKRGKEEEVSSTSGDVHLLEASGNPQKQVGG